MRDQEDAEATKVLKDIRRLLIAVVAVVVVGFTSAGLMAHHSRVVAAVQQEGSPEWWADVRERLKAAKENGH